MQALQTPRCRFLAWVHVLSRQFSGLQISKGIIARNIEGEKTPVTYVSNFLLVFLSQGFASGSCGAAIMWEKEQANWLRAGYPFFVEQRRLVQGCWGGLMLAEMALATGNQTNKIRTGVLLAILSACSRTPHPSSAHNLIISMQLTVPEFQHREYNFGLLLLLIYLVAAHQSRSHPSLEQALLCSRSGCLPLH